MFGMIKGGTLNLLSTTMPEQMAFSYMRSYLFRAFYLGKKGDLRCPFLLE